MNTHELLIAARKKIERPECWTQKAIARNRAGEEVWAADSDASCWCGYGAIWGVEQEAQPRPRDAALRARQALVKACGTSFPVWQDAPERTHAEVLKVFDIAIENTRGEG